MLQQFRHLYPQGSLLSELIEIDRGLYIVKVSVQDGGIILGTGLAAAETVEKAEDRARERALMTINLNSSLKTDVNPQIEPSLPTKTPKIVPQEVNSLEQASNHNSSSIKSSSIEQTVAEPFSPPELEDFVSYETEAIIAETNSSIESQINIFEQPLTPPPLETTPPTTAETTLETTVELDFNDIRHKIDLEMKRLHWTKEQGRDYLLSTYGKRSRLHLSDEELLEFWHYLETLPS